jgi:hydroxyethylthiazole kinase-like uncharacterized protein yjeF
MKLFSSKQMQDLDRAAVEQCHIPSLLLMEHAGNETAKQAEVMLGGASRKSIAVVCGPGNNGGDGLAAARILNDMGASIKIFLAVSPESLKGDPSQNFLMASAIGLEIQNPLSNLEAFRQALQVSNLLVDALFGTGLKRNLNDEMQRIIQCMNESQKPILSIDIPSGISADTGKILGSAVKATRTITLAAPKIGLYLYPGREHAGEIHVAYIGIPTRLIAEVPCEHFLLETQDVASFLPVWKPDLHKGEKGKVMVIGGARGLSGALVLACSAALESGAGLVYAGVPDGIRSLVEHKLTEAIKVGFPQTPNWVLGKASLPETRKWFDKINALGIGPGLGREPETAEYVKTVLQEFSGPMVVDADALYPLDDTFLKTHGKPNWILTPHEGEMARLCGIAPETVRKNRLELAREKALHWNATLVLKGASTLVAFGKKIWINPTGNPGMAVGGAGDVLTGLIASLLAQGMEPEKAAQTAVFIHGLAGDLCVESFGYRGVTASKLVSFLPKAFQVLKHSL